MRTAHFCGWGGGVYYIPRYTLPLDTPPPPNRLIDTCENITFPQLLLRVVINSKGSILPGLETIL